MEEPLFFSNHRCKNINKELPFFSSSVFKIIILEICKYLLGGPYMALLGAFRVK